MSSSARLALALVATAAGPLAAQSAGTPATVPAGLSARVAGEVARTWAADSAAVRLEWGSVPGAAGLAAGTPFRLVGKGDAGSWVVLFEPAGGSPSAVRVRAGILDTVPVATRPIVSGATLASTDLRWEPQVRWGPPAPADEASVTGWVTRRAIAAGQPIGPSVAAPPPLIRAGDAVQVEWQRGPVRVALEGVALNAAALGQPVKVRLAGRGGQRSGIAAAAGSVRLDS